jgi:YqjK-like protein
MSRNARAVELAIHREVMIQRADAQRQTMAAQLHPLRLAALRMDHRIHVAQRVLSSPIVVGLTAGMLIVIGPRRGLKFIKRSVELWSMWRNWLPRIAARFLKRAD